MFPALKDLLETDMLVNFVDEVVIKERLNGGRLVGRLVQ